jgi:type I restriction enzyme S subunit
MSKQSKLGNTIDDDDVNYRNPSVLAQDKDLPDDWCLKLASEICDIKTGHTPSRDVDEYWGGDIPWIAIHDLSGNETIEISETEESITNEGLKNSGAKLLPKGTLVLCRTGSIGASAIIDKEMATDQSTVSFECFSGSVSPYYLLYVFKQCQSELDRLGIGSTHPSIQLDFFPDLQVPTPPIEEQQKIASVLYTIDKNIQNTRSIIDQVYKIKSGIDQDLFHGQHKNYSEYVSTPVGNVPEHWEVVSIGDVVHTAQYGISESLSMDGEYPIFRMNNLKNGYMINEPMKYIDLDRDQFEKYHVKNGDILFNRTNSLKLVGKTGIYELDGDHVFASYLVRLQTNDRADPYYLNYYMNTSEAQNRMMDFATKGVSQANINAHSIQQVKLPLPPIDEQKQIAEKIKSLDRKIEVNERYEQKLQQLKRGLMQDLLSGKIRTHNKDIKLVDKVLQYG